MNDLYKYIDETLLSDFKEKFQLEKEVLWKDYLSEVMPIYKKNKDFHFINLKAENEDQTVIFKELLSMCVLTLESCDMHYHVRNFEAKHHETVIEKFKKDLNV